jgi:hypothetical protein
MFEYIKTNKYLLIKLIILILLTFLLLDYFVLRDKPVVLIIETNIKSDIEVQLNFIQNNHVLLQKNLDSMLKIEIPLMENKLLNVPIVEDTLFYDNLRTIMNYIAYVSFTFAIIFGTDLFIKFFGII